MAPAQGGELVKTNIPKAAQLYIAADEDENVDDILEYCSECRNVDIINRQVTCLGSEEYRRRRNCLDIEITWKKPAESPDPLTLDNGTDVMR